MSSDWTENRWGEIATLEYGKGLRGYEHAAGPYLVYGTNGPIGRHSEALCQYASVIVGRKGAYRGIHYSPQPFFVIDTAFYLQPKADIDTHWAYYELLTHDINGMDSGSAIPSTSREAFYNLRVMVPPLAEQQAIASILGALDDKIELNRRVNATLEAMARTIFQSWFVDFDPVRAKAEGRETGLPADIAALFPDGFVESELGEIPEGWHCGQLNDLTGLLPGYAFKSQDWQKNGVPVVKIGSVKPGIVDVSEVSYVSESVAHKASKYRLKPGDLLVGMTGYVGEIGLVPPTDVYPLLNQRVGKFLVDRRGTSAASFIYCLTRRDVFRDMIKQVAHGSVQLNVSADSILNLPLIVPQKNLRDTFEDLCSPLFARILKNHSETKTITDVRDSLLPRLISGELRVPEVETLVEQAIT